MENLEKRIRLRPRFHKMLDYAVDLLPRSNLIVLVMVMKYCSRESLTIVLLMFTLDLWFFLMNCADSLVIWDSQLIVFMFLVSIYVFVIRLTCKLYNAPKGREFVAHHSDIKSPLLIDSGLSSLLSLILQWVMSKCHNFQFLFKCYTYSSILNFAWPSTGHKKRMSQYILVKIRSK